jgi:hypothetical protein
MRQARRARRAAAIAALTVGMTVGAAAAPAAAAPATSSGVAAPAVAEFFWLDGEFEISGAPVLPEDSPPDGWSCYLLGSCRPGVLASAGLTADDAAPIAETRERAPVRVECGFRAGNWFKIHFRRPGGTADVAGWVAADAVDVVAAGGDVPRCSAFVDW